MTIRVCTIGFTKSTAAHFFGRLNASNCARLIDVRLNNTSQLAGFAKATDLEFFVKQICGMDYSHEPILAPTKDILDDFKKHKGDWATYRQKFMTLMERRAIEYQMSKDVIDSSCLLCSEAEPHHCHRDLVCEYLNGRWGGSLAVTHL